MRTIFSPTKQLVTPHEQGADFVELFFDLVFVYAITRITSLTAHNMDSIHVIQSMLIFWLIWWAWTQFTWTLNAANTRVAEVRMLVLVATGVAFIMASSVNEAFGTGVMWFAIPYVIIRIIGIGLYIRVISSVKGNHSRVIAFAAPSAVVWVFLIVGATVDPSQRIWWWLIATGFDMLSGFLGGRIDGWDVKPKHFAERHSLIVIIALGESLIVAASAVSSHGISQEILIVGLLAVLVTCLLWWSYFSWINEHLEEHLSKQSGVKQAGLARNAYSFLHFPLIFGIIGIAVGFEKILSHPHDMLNSSVAIALSGGYFLFVGFTATSVWSLSKMILKPRILILVFSAIGIYLTIGQPTYFALGIIVVSLILLTFIEWKKCRHS
jgi:low temperature requirement protein LtrA